MGLGTALARVVSPPGCVCAVHVTVQFSMDDNTKAQCVVCLRDGGYNLGPGPQTHNFFMPLTTDGLPYLDRMGRVSVPGSLPTSSRSHRFCRCFFRTGGRRFGLCGPRLESVRACGGCW